MAQLAKKTTNFDLNRFDYLQALVTEFQDTEDEEAKLQVLANLGNFAYDPINYEHLRRLKVIDLFLDALTDSNQKMIEFGLAGICNLCPDNQNKAYLVEHDAISLVIKQLSSPSETAVLNAISILMFLTTPTTRSETTAPAIVDAMQRLTKAKNTRIVNMASLFLEDYCSRVCLKGK